MKPERTQVDVMVLWKGMSERGGYTREQLTLLGVDWPPPKGWKAKVVGRSFRTEDVELFLKLARRK